MAVCSPVHPKPAPQPCIRRVRPANAACPPALQDDELPKPGDIEVELQDIYRHDEEQAYLTLMSQEVKSLNFAVEANYTVRLCKELVNYHYPDKMPLGSFELIASNKVRSDEETLSEVFNGDPYACDKEPADDPCFDWVPRKEQIFDEKKLMQVCACAPQTKRARLASCLSTMPLRPSVQMSIWKKEWDDETNSFEPIDLGCVAPHSARAPLAAEVGRPQVLTATPSLGMRAAGTWRTATTRRASGLRWGS
tara:strand:- start:1842 stop:2594 length:753 start_codon:yes stop_codon:yes gene_type:complete